MNLIKKVIQKLHREEDRSELFRFGVSIGLVLIIWGCVFVMRQKPGADYFFIASLFFLVNARFTPRGLAPIHSLLKNMLRLLSWAMTSVILVIVFYLVMTPIGFFGRMVGHRFLDLRYKTDENSYWIPRDEKNMEKERYENQF
ncbi:MAG: hypothetical protein JXD21_04730 [Candidatus Omnitrophica bacterium]|nr:hypothetical protein [Candidatus Omnitrophota bacterium]